MDISRYEQRHENDVIEAISKDPNWEILTNETTIAYYRNLLSTSIAYVCYESNAFCGYVRAILDTGVAVYVSELYVVEKWRNISIGQMLLERVKNDYSHLYVYAFSDEDEYYIKKGFTKIGSVFKLQITMNMAGEFSSPARPGAPGAAKESGSHMLRNGLHTRDVFHILSLLPSSIKPAGDGLAKG